MSKTHAVQIYSQPFQRLFVVGDIHGCYQQLMQKLQQLGFDFQQDLLVSVGDLVDRGPESLKCLNLIDQPWFTAILGNHEEMCLLSEHDPAMADLHSQHGGEWLYALDPEQQAQVRARCRRLPIVLEIEHQQQHYGFVHADVDHNDWQAFKQAVTRSHDVAIWSRGRIRNKRPHLYHHVQGIDRVYLGHTVVPQVTQRDNCYYLDTGAVFGHHLSVVEIDIQQPIEQQLKVIQVL
ncbi:serine/threonine protein phosphatase 1 [Acinetobacter calcoaceticus]|uniref:Serine/threonine protein phosphatase 1 n=1 Tax=Acinetobacter calcoaceticus TaxID=471 RepID=A0A4V2R242_ACICA|nr:serine/threonine protein phosphatase 1 [Acinetobacter calcoaceticus]